MLRFHPFFTLLALSCALPDPTLAQAPVVTTRTPARNTHTAPLATPVAVTFSQPVSAPTATGIKVNSVRAGGRKAGSYSTAGSTVSFDPTADFEPGETVLVSVPPTVQSTGGVAAARQVYQFTTAVGGPGKGNFRGGSDVGIGMLSQGLAVGDVDGDGDLDVASASGYSNTVGIRLNGGNASGSNTGIFSGTQNVTVGDGPRSVAFADVDGDGDLDLLTVNQRDNDVDIALNGGNATGSNTGIFSYGSIVPVGSEPYAVAVSDVDGDGDLDLLAANSGSGTVSVRLNGGDATGSNTGTFSGTQNVRVGNRPQSLALADVDGDGDMDLLAGNSSGNTVSVRLNGGDATGSNTGIFSGTQEVAVNGAPLSVAVGDVDGDGDLDLVAPIGASVSVRLNGGDASGSNSGLFSGTQNVMANGVLFGVALGDVDADGDLDLAVSSVTAAGSGAFTDEVFIRLNGGDATGSNTGIFSGGYAPVVNSRPYSIALADVDGDLDLDLLAASFMQGSNASSSVSVRLNQPPPPAVTSLTPLSGPAGTIVALGGSSLLGAAVVVNGVPVAISNASNTGFAFTLPAGAAPTGMVVVTTPGGSVSTMFTISLQVVGTTPGVNSLNAPRANSAVQVRFSEPVTAGTAGNLRVFSNLAGGRKQGTTTAGGLNLTFAARLGTPATHFQPGEVVSVSVPAAIRSAGGIAATPRVFRFTTPVSGPGRGNFGSGVDVVVHDLPTGVTTADVDNDGDQDIISACYGRNGQGNVVSVRLNNGSGGFSFGADLQVYGSTSGVLDVAAADVDNDGDIDILSGNGRANNVSVLLNNGTGTFSLSGSPAVPGSPRRVTMADIDGDGDLDLLAALNLSNTVSIRLNVGNANFFGGPDLVMGSGTTTVTSLATGDVDGDGDLDLLANNSSGNTVSLRLNDGSGTFGSVVTIPVGTGPSSISLADVDGDLDLDLLAANAGTNGSGNTVSVRLNNGSGSFSGGSDPQVGPEPSVVATADVDADGDLDLLTANNLSNTVSVRLNNGRGTFSGGSDPQVDTSTFTRLGAQGLALADMDGDGDLDLLTANSGNPSGTTISVRLNQAPSPVISSFSPAAGPAGTSVVITGTNLLGTTAVTFNGVAAASFTVNSATQVTAVVPATAANGPISVTAQGVTGSSTQAFTITNSFTVLALAPAPNLHNAPRSAPLSVLFDAPVSGMASSTAALRAFSSQAGGRVAGTAAAVGNTLAFTPAAAFKPGETVMATLTTDVRSAGGRGLFLPRVFQFTTAAGAGSGTFAPPSSFPAGNSPWDAKAADMNGDGRLDMLVANINSNTVSIFFNDAAAPFTRVATVRMPQPTSMGVADLDNDGDLDLYNTHLTNPVIIYQLNDGTGTAFTSPNPVSIGSGAQSATAADVNGDGFLDLLSANYYDNSVSIRLNNRQGSFTSTPDVLLSAGTGALVLPMAVAVADVDADGDWDMVTVNRQPNTLTVLRNNGSGAFGVSATVALPQEPWGLRSGDVNGDGLLDMVVSYTSSSQVQALLGTAGGSFTLGTPNRVGSSPRTFALGDIDGDGDLDVAAANYDSNTISVRSNDGTGSFSGSTELMVGANPQGLALADMDGDTDLDLLVGVRLPSAASLFLNLGTPTASRQTALSAQVALYPNPARGHFTLALPALTGHGPLALTLYNALGQVVLQQQLPLPGTATTIGVQVSQLAPGTYTLHGRSGSQSFTKKVVLE